MLRSPGVRDEDVQLSSLAWPDARAIGALVVPSWLESARADRTANMQDRASRPRRLMPVVYLTRRQLDAVVEFAKEHPFSVSLEEGESGESYVTATLMDAEGNAVEVRSWNWTGQMLPSEGTAPD
jgi:hypothetical protein